MSEPSYITAHKHSSHHRQEILESEQGGCFYCLAVFPPSAIEEWVDTDEHEVGQTALCPQCGIDAVIGSKSGYPITKAFLQAMEEHWFSTT